MRYRYVFAAEIRGLIAPKGAEIVINVPRFLGTVTYTAERDSIPEIVDIRGALASLMLGGLAGRTSGDLRSDMERQVQLVRINRAKQSSDMLVILDATGETDFELKHDREDEEYIVSFGDSTEKDIRNVHERYVQSLLSALCLASPRNASARKLVDCVLFYRQDGKPIFCYEMQVSGTAYTASPMTQEVAGCANRYALQLSKGGNYAEVSRLLSKSMELSNNQLLSFMSAWAALEVFINKVFKEYEKQLFDSADGKQIPAHPEVLRRMRAVMSDKFRLTDKFAIIASPLDKTGIDADMETFRSMKELRDKLFHGAEMSTRNLPCEIVRSLVRKYLRLHLDFEPMKTAGPAVES